MVWNYHLIANSKIPFSALKFKPILGQNGCILAKNILFKKHAGNPTCCCSWRTPSGCSSGCCSVCCSPCCDIRPCCCVVVAWWERRMRLRGRWRGWRKPSWWLLGVPFLRWVGAAKRWEVKWCLLPNLPRLLYPLKKKVLALAYCFLMSLSRICVASLIW